MADFFTGSIILLLLALLLDRMVGEPSRAHPLIFFGVWVDIIKQKIRRYDKSKNAHINIHADQSLQKKQQRTLGVIAWLLAVLPCLILLSLILSFLPDFLTLLVSIVVIYFCIGWQSLREHSLAILHPLLLGDLEKSRTEVGRIVSRDTHSLNKDEIVKASVESVLENGSDAIFAPIFWFLVLGVPGVLLYRLANTLDAMWGYKNEEFLHFGWCAARVDDVLNYLPARLVILTYAICGNFVQAMAAAKMPQAKWKSPNAGPVMAAGAGALDIVLGGKATYFGKDEERPLLGITQEQIENTEQKKTVLDSKHLKQAIQLIDKGVFSWAFVLFISWLASL